VLVIAVATVVIAGGTVARGGRGDWIGTAKCGSCHQPQLAAWRLTPHATTAKRFGNAKPEVRCLACHGTGEAPAGPAIAIEVGCEACHGAGAGYGEDDLMRNVPVARALGLVDVSGKGRAVVCSQCHIRPLRGKVFDPAAPVHPVATP
jgi:Cytochrome c554 and c-prime